MFHDVNFNICCYSAFPSPPPELWKDGYEREYISKFAIKCNFFLFIDTAQLFKRYQNRMSQTTVITKDPFKLKELEDLLNEITSHAKMTGGENERLRLLVNNSKLFGYCTKNVPASACLPCACTPHNKLNNEYSCDCTNLQPKKDCKAFFESGFRVDGVYTLQPDGSKNNVSVFCDQTSDRGGWEVIQRRRDGSTGFHRDWNEYELGFGDVHRDFYLGNEKIHLLTKTRKQLFIKMTDFNGRTYSALYDKFHVADNTQKYRLNCSGLIWGNVGDNFCQFHSGMYFSSYDSDNDKRSQMNCAAGSAGGGGWWYSNCYGANLNGVYYQTRRQDSNGIKWSGVDSSNTLKKVEMKIRRP